MTLVFLFLAHYIPNFDRDYVRKKKKEIDRDQIFFAILSRQDLISAVDVELVCLSAL